MREVHLLGSRGQILRALAPETRRERMRGLIDRTLLADDEALLLERTKSIQTFGMRWPICAALLDGELTVRSVLAVPPSRLLLPRLGVRHVLECAVGTDLRPGDRLRMVDTH
jgi:uncharacterized membrane protein (UPF0127 family)